MQKFIMVMGMTNNGKMKRAQELAEQLDNVVILSSEAIREELFGDKNDKDNQHLVLKTMRERNKEQLSLGKSVIYVATNASSRRREFILNSIVPKEVYKELHYMHLGLVNAVAEPMEHNRGSEVEDILQQYSAIQTPMTHEKWDKVVIDTGETQYKSPKLIETIVEREEMLTYEEFTKVLEGTCLYSMLYFPQDHPKHTFTLDKHTYYAYEYIFNNYHKEDREDMILASIFHDIGKVDCQEYRGDSRYASYIGHEQVGGQLTLRILLQLGLPQERALKISTLVTLHGHIPQTIALREKLERKIGSEMYIRLNYLQQADFQAK